MPGSPGHPAVSTGSSSISYDPVLIDSNAEISVCRLHDLIRYPEYKFCMKHEQQFSVVPAPAHRQVPHIAGHVIMPNGLGLVVGGDNGDLSWPFTNGLTSVRIIDPFQASYALGPGLPSSRWYPSLLTLADGNILVMGGAQVRCYCRTKAKMSPQTLCTVNDVPHCCISHH